MLCFVCVCFCLSSFHVSNILVCIRCVCFYSIPFITWVLNFLTKFSQFSLVYFTFDCYYIYLVFVCLFTLFLFFFRFEKYFTWHEIWCYFDYFLESILWLYKCQATRMVYWTNLMGPSFLNMHAQVRKKMFEFKQFTAKVQSFIYQFIFFSETTSIKVSSFCMNS